LKIALVVNHDWFFLSHRKEIAQEAVRQGHEVWLIACDTGRRKEIEAMGIRFKNFPIFATSKNPIRDLYTFLYLVWIYARLRPDVIHHITLKVALWGSLAAKVVGNHHVVNAIAGFGIAFSDYANPVLRKCIQWMLKLACKSRHFHFILQNTTDFEQTQQLKLVPDEHLHLINGSGVNLDVFVPHSSTPNSKLTIVLHARMLREKGVEVAVNAMRKERTRLYGRVRLLLAGGNNSCNPSTLSDRELHSYEEEGYIEWVGYQKDMVSVLQNADIACLPSFYREGLPKALIEACACGLPIITTDRPGCRECVIEGVNGYMVPACDVDSLADAILKMVEHPERLQQMGRESRRLAEQKFDVHEVVKKHLEIYNELNNNK